MSRITREAVFRYLHRTDSHSAIEDPLYSAQWHWMKHILDIADMAMEDGGISERSRSRVVRTILYGAPDEADAELRTAERQKQVKWLTENPAPLDFGGLGNWSKR
jgi:hypothetical protein